MSTSKEEILAKKQKLGIDEEHLIKLADEKFANIIDPNFGIARKKVVALKLLLFSFDAVNNLPTTLEKKIVYEFLINIQGDMNFNKELQAIAKMELAGKGRGAVLVSDLIRYTYKTRHVGIFKDVYEKFDKIAGNILYDNTVKEEEKLSLKEFACINDIAQIETILKEFASKEFFYEVEELSIFLNRIIKCAEIIKKIREKYKMVNNIEMAAVQQAQGRGPKIVCLKNV